MNERKFPHGKAPKQEDAVLEDDTVEAVTGGTGSKTSSDWIEEAWDWINQHFGENDDKEDEP